MTAHLISRASLDQHAIQFMNEQAFDEDGTLKIMESAFWRQFNQVDISAFCVMSGLYCLPTIELMVGLEQLILGASPSPSPSRNVIEIGSGNGAIGKYLGIPATDSKQQDDPALQVYYRSMGQAPVKYGQHVIQLDANAAVEQYRPDVVIGAWVTHGYNPDESWRGGNTWGIDEARILAAVRRYVVIGHRQVHKNKPILELPHWEFQGSDLFSRSMTPEDLTVFVWDNPETTTALTHEA